MASNPSAITTTVDTASEDQILDENTILYIIIGVLVLIILCGVIAFLYCRYKMLQREDESVKLFGIQSFKNRSKVPKDIIDHVNNDKTHDGDAHTKTSTSHQNRDDKVEITYAGNNTQNIPPNNPKPRRARSSSNPELRHLHSGSTNSSPPKSPNSPQSAPANGQSQDDYHITTIKPKTRDRNVSTPVANFAKLWLNVDLNSSSQDTRTPAQAQPQPQSQPQGRYRSQSTPYQYGHGHGHTQSTPYLDASGYIPKQTQQPHYTHYHNHSTMSQPHFYHGAHGHGHGHSRNQSATSQQHVHNGHGYTVSNMSKMSVASASSHGTSPGQGQMMQHPGYNQLQQSRNRAMSSPQYQQYINAWQQQWQQQQHEKQMQTYQQQKSRELQAVIPNMPTIPATPVDDGDDEEEHSEHDEDGAGDEELSEVTTDSHHTHTREYSEHSLHKDTLHGVQTMHEIHKFIAVDVKNELKNELNQISENDGDNGDQEYQD